MSLYAVLVLSHRSITSTKVSLTTTHTSRAPTATYHTHTVSIEQLVAPLDFFGVYENYLKYVKHMQIS